MATKKSTSKPKTTSLTRLQRFFPWLLLIGGIIGVLAAGILTVEKIELLKNPSASLSCDLNPIIACGSVINTPQASAFGFPNPIIGLVGFSVVATIGAALLAGAQFRRWFWLGLQGGTVFGIAFVTWLQYQSIYKIGALCPYCMVVWTVTIAIFVGTTLYNLRNKHLALPQWAQPVGRFVQAYPIEIAFTWYLVIIGLITTHFWYYWSTLL